MLKCTKPIPIKRGNEMYYYPCRKCLTCKKNIAHMWSERLLMEQTGKESFFLTLTYDNEHEVDEFYQLKKDCQDFLKRLRKYLGKTKIKYFYCGEAGEETLRLHLHMIIIGWQPKDLWILGKSNGKNKYSSKIINKLWQWGSNQVGTCTKESIYYVTGYILKSRHKGEFRHMSKGIGLDYCLKHKNEILEMLSNDKIKVGRYISDKIDLIHNEKINLKIENNDAKKIKENTELLEKKLNTKMTSIEFYEKWQKELEDERIYRETLNNKKFEIFTRKGV
jgi:hypothetical protein